MVSRANQTEYGAWVQKRLIDLNMSQATLASKIGINRQYLYKVLAEERSGNKKRYKEKINEILKVR